MRIIFLAYLVIHNCLVFSQNKPVSPKIYRATLLRSDSLPIVFTVESRTKNNIESWTIRNADEKLQVTNLRQKGDSILIDMPFFESFFQLKKQNDSTILGTWTKATSTRDQVMPVYLITAKKRFELIKGNASVNISGRWKVVFKRAAGTERPAIAEFKQNQNHVTGTFLTPSGDYRYLEGVVTGDSLLLSCFDGSHAYFFSASITKDGKIYNGVYASGAVNKESWSAVKDPCAEIDASSAAMYLKEGEEELNFSFPDLDSNIVSIRDPKFKNKVVIIQIMGSWCPNCMDETAFLSKFYDENKKKGIEVLALAYEYSTDFSRAQKSLKKFQQRFDVKYPMLITGAKTSDSLRTEKTLPQLTPIKVFPSTVFLDKAGKVRKIHTGFFGPGTGEHHIKFKKEFETVVTELLAEPSTNSNTKGVANDLK